MEISVTVYGSLYYLSRRVLLSLLVACLFVFNFSVCVWVLFFLRREIYSCRYQKLDLDFFKYQDEGDIDSQLSKQNTRENILTVIS